MLHRTTERYGWPILTFFFPILSLLSLRLCQPAHCSVWVYACMHEVVCVCVGGVCACLAVLCAWVRVVVTKMVCVCVRQSSGVLRRSGVLRSSGVLRVYVRVRACGSACVYSSLCNLTLPGSSLLFVSSRAVGDSSGLLLSWSWMYVHVRAHALSLVNVRAHASMRPLIVGRRDDGRNHHYRIDLIIPQYCVWVMIHHDPTWLCPRRTRLYIHYLKGS